MIVNGDANHSSFSIPTIDISPYLRDPTGIAAQHVVDSIRDALRSTGFFQLLGHGVPRKIQLSAFDASKRFFGLPMEVKTKYAASLESGWKGYEILAGQSYKSNMLGDLKEGVSLAMDLPMGHPLRGVRGRFLTSLTVWPDEPNLPMDEFRKPIEAYCDALSQLCGTVMDLIAATLPYGATVFNEMKIDAACPLRLLHYPPMPPGVDESEQHGASAHTDFSAITLLLQDENAGLEVFNHDEGTWHTVEPNPDAYVVNLGDMMTKLLGDRYRSALHRVINRAPTDRYSIVYFFDGNRDFKLQPLDRDSPAAADDQAQYLTCEQYMFDRIRSSYATHNKHDLSLSSTS
ncbi:Clavaminate synthase-like protein [Periconia macrospinosa]|uniref:Clavaminate synthase-like protein n=1 Tax=Periconia macrospinosa TaxID=97972 RepID=A0A2V1D566_9PLEO|nr:Clavaminate synthase-like protein [Periconia macrospinosa]